MRAGAGSRRAWQSSRARRRAVEVTAAATYRGAAVGRGASGQGWLPVEAHVGSPGRGAGAACWQMGGGGRSKSSSNRWWSPLFVPISGELHVSESLAFSPLIRFGCSFRPCRSLTFAISIANSEFYCC
ncbi:hypothetical protein J5N97_001281 [Dioscorea zingiberensis]|uniref:Uncharacterized protein n=1 Tax=Dioscorea zingiberensis TaxID=325984 RepID=A0A9D5BU36_9LILI|nr:hypothetical protein J5N97_001281 [Dioscorea zingiberensis]